MDMLWSTKSSTFKCEFLFVYLAVAHCKASWQWVKKPSSVSRYPGYHLYSQICVTSSWPQYTFLFPSFPKLCARSIISYFLPCSKEVRVKNACDRETPSRSPIAVTHIHPLVSPHFLTDLLDPPDTRRKMRFSEGGTQEGPASPICNSL